MKQHNWASTKIEEIVQRAVNAKAKADLRSSIMVWDSNARCPKDHHLSHNTSLKVQTQGFKDFFRSKKSKLWDLKAALVHDDMAELAKKEDRKDKKKRFWN